jgi:hypothetical protein
MVHSSLASSVKVGKHEGDGSRGEQPCWESRDNSDRNEYAKNGFHFISRAATSQLRGFATQFALQIAVQMRHPSICKAIIFATQLRNKNKAKGLQHLHQNATKVGFGTPMMRCKAATS